MPDSGALRLPEEIIQPTGLLQTLLATALVAVAVLRPLYEEDEVVIRDFAWVYLNPAGQQMLRQSECPTASLLTLFPTAQQDGVFAKCCQAFETGEVQRNQTYYQADGLDGYFLLAAQRCDSALVVNFTDTHEWPRTAAEEALRASEARERSSREQLQLAQTELTRMFGELPIAVAVYEGPAHVLTFYNDVHEHLAGRPLALGQAAADLFPDLVGQPFFQIPDQVYATGEPLVLVEAPVSVRQPDTGELAAQYFTVRYLPRRDVQGRVTGLLVTAVPVTEQVAARQQVQQLNAELAASNEELRAAVQEYQTSNATLRVARQQLEQLNQKLEARVQERTSQLAEQQLLLSHILRQVPAAVATLSGPEHRFSFANAAYQDLVANRATLGLRVADALPEVVEQGIIELLDQVYTSGQPFVGREVAIILESAAVPFQTKYLDFTYQPLTDEQGQVEGILVFVVEVTEQVRARRQTDTLQRAMLATTRRQAQQRQELYQIVEQTAVAIVLLREPDHRIDYYNPAFAELFPPEEWLGGSLQGHCMTEVYPHLKVAGLLELLDRVFQTGETQTVLDMPLAELQPGSPRYITFTYQAYREETRIVGVAAFAYDVTEQVLARKQVHQLNEQLATTNQELHASNRQLTRTNADLDTFVYTASHDLKAPIANIEGLLDVLREYLPPADQEPMVPRLMGMIQAAIARFQQTVGHLTDVSHLQQDPDQELDEIDLASLVEGVRLDLLPLLESRQARLLVDVAACPRLRFATKTLRSIVYNLVSNAVKYRAPDRLPVVQLRAQCLAEQVVLEVQDNGLGLDEVQQGKLFTMFKRLHTHVEGSGVGLYMIKRLIDNGGGTIAVQSQPGVGSIFTVTLPRA